MKKQNAGCSTKLAHNDSTPLKAKLTRGCTLLLLAMALVFTSCNDNEDNWAPLPAKTGSVYVINEGGFGVDGGSLTVYNPKSGAIELDIFAAANGGAKIGSLPTSLTMIDGKAFVTMSGSKSISIIDPLTGILKEKITDLSSPRFIQWISADKVYVSNLSSNVIDIINPRTATKTGQITLDEGNFAEQFVRQGNYVYTNLWSYGNKVLKIDAITNKVVGSVEVGTQPIALMQDKLGRLWTLTDGGYQGGPLTFEDPAIVCINTSSFTIEKKIKIPRGQAIMYKIAIDPAGENIYYIDKNIYKMPIDATTLPTEPFISYKEADGKVHNYYSIGVNPDGGDLYLGDAVDFFNKGMVLRYNKLGEKLASFGVDVNPGGFAFIPTK